MRVAKERETSKTMRTRNDGTTAQSAPRREGSTKRWRFPLRLDRNVRGLLSLLLLSLVLALSGWFDGLERWAYGTAMRLADARPAAEVLLVGVDRETLDALGPWPLDPSVLARFHRAVSEMLPRAVAYTWPLVQGADSEAAGLYRALREGVPAVVAAPYGSGAAGLDPPQSAVLGALAIPAAAAGMAGDVPEVGWVEPPTPAVAKVAGVGLGPVDAARHPGEARFSVPMVLHAGGHLLPAFALQVVARAQGVAREQLRLREGGGIHVGNLDVETDAAFRVRPFYRQGRGGTPAFREISFLDLIEGRVPPAVVSGKVVMVGLGAGTAQSPVATPIGAWMKPAELSANVVASLLAGEEVRAPWWAWAVAALAWILAAAFLVWGLPHLKLVSGLIAGLLIAGLFLNIEALALLSRSVWLPMASPALMVLAGLVWWGLDHRFSSTLMDYRTRLDEARRQLAKSYQDQGQLDDALDLLRRCTVDDALLDRLYHLGLDFERKRLHARAMETFQFIAAHRPDYKDARDRMARNQRQVNALTVPGTGARSADDPLAVSNGLQKPMLGRYQVDRVLGKGEMGVVYLGHDPKINRRVAIKTMALSDEFDGEVLTDVRERFFREASTAGKLNHPNIVTIYDVGEERGLAYIAMDYLTGQSVSRHTKPETLLPVSEVLRIGIQVAAALDYAHRHNVVHRDIKPANIIYDTKKRQATVTDFGVACLTDTSKTRSGVILGTPAFMSPEQLAGRRVDGRSDIFSLGVTLFQLLTGRLPFSGDSISTLMYRIANEPHPDIRDFRPDLPECLGSIIDKALAKEPQFRYARAGLMATALRRCVREAAAELSGSKRAQKEKPLFKEVVLD